MERVWTGGGKGERGLVLGPVWSLVEVLLPATWDQPRAAVTGNLGLEDDWKMLEVQHK